MSDLKTELTERFNRLASQSSGQLSREVSTLFEGTSISENDQTKFLHIIEASVNSKALLIAEESIAELNENVEEYAEYVKESLEVKANEYGEYVKESLSTNLNSYMEYVADEYIKENELAISNGLKSEMFESLVTSMKDIFVENNIVVPEDSVDVVAELQEEVNERDVLNDKLLSENVSLRTEMTSFSKNKEISEACLALADTQKEKVLELSESLEYNDEFSSKLKNIVEFASKKDAPRVDISEQTQKTITESGPKTHNKVNDVKMSAYLKSASGN
ncbi:prohead core scaffold protein [Paraglaciecola Antarctic GD virus 1]|nr:prohead core scaffold protein [Paraglaciecola Antarctic GD virus 1]